MTISDRAGSGTLYAVSFKDMVVYDARSIPTESFSLEFKNDALVFPIELKRRLGGMDNILTTYYKKWLNREAEGILLGKEEDNNQD